MQLKILTLNENQRNHVFPMVKRCSLLFMHKIFPLFAFIYINRLLGTLDKSSKTQKSVESTLRFPVVTFLWWPTAYIVLNVTCVPEQVVVFPLWFVKIRV